MTEPKLKLCPFCGEEAHTLEQYIDSAIEQKRLYYYIVGCKTCGIAFRRTSKQKAIEAWNHRVGEVAE